MNLHIVWFILFAVLIIGYAILDGFDLGVGVLHFFARDDHERRLHLNAIGPVWDGNEVWLLTAGGALFAAFPVVYATVFSGFYLAFMLLLLALIMRAIAIEFRSKVENAGWRALWDRIFAIGSLLPSILFGVAVGNILRGIPINQQGTFTGTFLGLLNPFAILIGVLSLFMFVMHGAIYMTLKTTGDLRTRMKKYASTGWIGFVVCYIIAAFFSTFSASYLFDGALGNPLSWLFFLVLFAAIVFIPIALNGKRYWRAFVASSIAITSLISLAAVGMFPRLVPSSTNLAFSLTIYNASSSEKTLMTMMIIALIGMPLVILYTYFIYRIFAGKVILTKESY